MLSILAPLLVFGLVVFVHELGHFLAAKLTGVYAPRFSIGFGPALFKKRVGETEYVLAALPLGGYVRMASREDEAVAFLEGGAEHPSGTVPTTGANAAGRAVDDHSGDPVTRADKDWDPNAMAPFGPLPVPEHRWFESKSLPARLFILLAGVAMNVLLAFVVFTGVVAAYGRPKLPTVIAPIVDSVLAGQPAAAAGVRAGDRIEAIDGVATPTWTDVVAHVSPIVGDSLTVRVRRGAAPLDLRVRTVATQVTDTATGRPQTVGRIGIAPRIVAEREHVGFATALREGVRETWATTGWVADVVKRLFSGKVAVSSLGGPVAIARTSVQAAREGFETLLRLIAMLSVNIAVLNLLPIPVLDGGQVVINVLEAVKGSAFSRRSREYILRFGLASVGLLFVTVMWNDLTHLFTDLFRR